MALLQKWLQEDVGEALKAKNQGKAKQTREKKKKTQKRKKNPTKQVLRWNEEVERKLESNM